MTFLFLSKLLLTLLFSLFEVAVELDVGMTIFWSKFISPFSARFEVISSGSPILWFKPLCTTYIASLRTSMFYPLTLRRENLQTLTISHCSGTGFYNKQNRVK